FASVSNGSFLQFVGNDLFISSTTQNIFDVTYNSKLNMINLNGSTMNATLISTQILYNITYNSEAYIDNINYPAPPVTVVPTIYFNILRCSKVFLVSSASINGTIPANYNPTDTYVLGDSGGSGGGAVLPIIFTTDYAEAAPQGCILC